MEIPIIILLSVILFETTFLVLKSISKKKSVSKRKIYVDTSALIDGRILGIANSGFLTGQLVIPRSVIHELQLLADGKDHEKRTAARGGMQTARDLERVEFCDVEILQDDLDRTPVDDRLIALAKENRGTIFTTDYNLCQVAATEHIDTLNPNSLSSILDISIPEGATFDVHLYGRGAKLGQAVGHLDNGTMVVVSHATRYIGQTIRVIVLRTTSSDAGRIIFTEPYLKKSTSNAKPAKSDSRLRTEKSEKSLPHTFNKKPTHKK